MPLSRKRLCTPRGCFCSMERMLKYRNWGPRLLKLDRLKEAGTIQQMQLRA